MGLDINAIASGDLEEIHELCSLAGLADDCFAKRPITKPNSMRYLRAGEAPQTATLDRGGIHICPSCIREDVERCGSLWHAIHQWHWQLRHMQICILHHCEFITLPTPQVSGGRHDFIASIREGQALEQAIQNDRAPVLPTELETYLSLRCYGAQTACWGDQFGIPALCR